MLDIDTKLLRSFLSVASEKSFSTAADRLGCTQGTMSVRIRTLEDLLGQRLFERSWHNLKLTAAGRDLLPNAQSVVDMHDRLIDRASGRQDSGRVRLGVGEGNDVSLLSRLRQRIGDDYANMELDIVCRPGRVLAELISAGELDIAIVALVEATKPATVLSRPRCSGWQPRILCLKIARHFPSLFIRKAAFCERLGLQHSKLRTFRGAKHSVLPATRSFWTPWGPVWQLLS